MTHLLQKAVAKISELPETEQNAFAHWVLDELASERQWERSFAETEDLLNNLADEALAEVKSRKTKNLDPERL